jgi:hypothetical protein
MKSTFGIQPWQIQRIHIAKQHCKLSDEDYRGILSNFNNADGIPCRSSKELTETQANALLDVFKIKLGWKEKRKDKDGKYEKYGSRDSKFATAGQLELIDSKWYNNPNVILKTDEALNHFISRILKVDHISFVLKKDVNRLIKAIQSITPYHVASPLERGEGCVNEP